MNQEEILRLEDCIELDADQLQVVASAISTFGEDCHPCPDADNIGMFSVDYAYDCCVKALRYSRRYDCDDRGIAAIIAKMASDWNVYTGANLRAISV